MFPLRAGYGFIIRHLNCMYQEAPGFLRCNYGIDIAFCSSNVRVCKFILVFFHLLGSHLFRVFSFIYLSPENDIGCTFKAPSRQFLLRAMQIQSLHADAVNSSRCTHHHKLS